MLAMENQVQKKQDGKKILVGSPVYQKPEILEVFLASLKNLFCGNAILDYMFVDDNVDEKSSRMLAGFCREGSAVILLKGTEKTVYVCDGESHHWDDFLMLKVANYKNTIIRYAIDHEYDELFFVDSDLVLHPELILHLERAQKEIVSELFWSQWHEGLPLEPNVWLFDEYDLVPKRLNEELSEEEKVERRERFMEELRTPGLYEVGGLGACTLIRRSALLKGVNFSPISNLTIHGEDRFFCIRAAVLGIPLFVDTCLPAYHIYRDEDLAGVTAYQSQWAKEIYKNKITLSMVVRNEEGHYLERVLNSLSGHVDNAVIIDDASTDGTVAMCRNLLKGIPLKIVRNTESMFADEVKLRKKQWDETIREKPDWILNLDADELVEESFWEEAQEIIDNPLNGCCDFRLFDMWDETHYREDEFWNAHSSGRTFLLRYQPQFQYHWLEIPQHCGRFPVNSKETAKAGQKYRIQHLGWSAQEDRLRKYKRYQQLDPGAIYGIREQYESILDQEPNLVAWEER